MTGLFAPPHPFYVTEMQHRFQEWAERAASAGELGPWMRAAAEENLTSKALLAAVFGHSSYLTRLLFLYPEVLRDFEALGADGCFAQLMQACDGPLPDDAEALTRPLRELKGRVALLVALADMAGSWALEQVTGALSALAEAALGRVVDTLLLASHRRGEIVLADVGSPSDNSGLIVLGMGKLGGKELNYSSDIDLILFYEPGRLGYKGRHTEQHFMNRAAQTLVTVMQERTPQGYVFRTDLRLRPDPASTPPVVTVDAAYYYYESVGQNWERAAMIKARPVAGDRQAAERFLKGIMPFMWRRNLDFAAINDIHSIKRQMDTLQGKRIEIAGHNIKLGRGGIREIEFFVQIHQLIWGGREPVLRSRATCQTLSKLCEYGLVAKADEALLLEAYAFYRKLEHRLQMVADEQTHSMPETEEGVAQIARFMGFEGVEAFRAVLLGYLTRVHGIFASSFKTAGVEELGDVGNLVFTGTVHDPDTIETLKAMGYKAPATISEIVMGWHHGSRRATRTQRARELLTELMPLLLKRLSETANPDGAFLRFNEFLLHLPSGVQLFSLFHQNPQLLGLISDIMGSAPTLADTLSRSPELLDAVLYADFYGPLPSPGYLLQQLNDTVAGIEDFDLLMNSLRRFRNEKQFQAGVQLLKGMITPVQTGAFLSQLADVTLQKALELVTAEFEKTYGVIAGARFAILSLGRLGSREITFGSDIDLVFVYDADFDAVSDGAKAFSASVYYNRLVQRLLNALTALGRDGRLYEVDTRLRPSGKQGLLAVSLQALKHYFSDLAWTFEFMALCKARPNVGDMTLRLELQQFILQALAMPRDTVALRTDILDMRERIAKEHGTQNPWDIKQVRGGLMDMDFMAQYLLLLHAPDMPGVRTGNVLDIFRWLVERGLMEGELAAKLDRHYHFLTHIFSMLRLCSEGNYRVGDAPQGLKKLLVDAVGEADFESLSRSLIQVEQSVLDHYITFFTA